MVLYYVFTAISIIFLILSVTTVIKHIIEHTFGLSIAYVFILLFLAIFFARFPVVCTENNFAGSFGKILSSILTTAVHTLQSFTLDESYETLFTVALPCVEFASNSFIRIFYETYISLLNICAPVVTYSILLTVVISFINKMTISLSTNKEKVIFSVLNEKTVIMGEKLREKNKKCVIIYANTNVNALENESFKIRVKKIYAVCQSQAVEDISFIQNKYRKITYFLAENELDNFTKCTKLLSSDFLTNKLIVDIYVLSVTKSSEQLFSNLLAERKNKNIKIYPICNQNIMIYNMLLENPLYLRASRDKLSAMIIGDSDYAYEAIKAFIWCGTYSYYNFTLHVITSDVEFVKDKLKSECPEIFSCGEYNIKFAESNPLTNKFDEYLQNDAKDVNYVFISTNSASENIKISIKVSKIYDILHFDGSDAPICTYVVEDDDLYKTLQPSKNVRNECLAIPVGNLSKCWDIDSLMDSDLERMAMSVHFSYYRLNLKLEDSVISKIKEFLLKGADFSLGENALSDKYFIELINNVLGNKKFDLFKAKIKRKLFAKKLSSDSEFKQLQSELYTRENAFADYNESIYGRNSSYASAIHALYRLFLSGIIGNTAKFTEEDLHKYREYIKDKNNLIFLSKMEHHRWNAYMRTDGFRKPTEEEFDYIAKTTKKHKNDRLKLHPCLVEWEKDYGIPLCDDNLNIIPKYYELYHNKDEKFLQNEFLTELDELDRVSLITSEVNPKKRFEHKSSDSNIVVKAPDILMATKNKGFLI